MNIELLTTIFVALVLANVVNTAVINPLLNKFFIGSHIKGSSNNLSGSASKQG
jgi:hypothetical protein